jgi:hypothetical protein
MSAEAIVAISAAVVACTQLSKWAKLPDHLGPIAVILLSGVGVGIWLASQTVWPPVRTDIWPIFAGWVAVALSAAGVFGFTRAGAEAVSRATSPPSDGAGSSATGGVPDTDALADALMDRIRQEMNGAAPVEPEMASRRRSRPPLDGGS